MSAPATMQALSFSSWIIYCCGCCQLVSGNIKEILKSSYKMRVREFLRTIFNRQQAPMRSSNWLELIKKLGFDKISTPFIIKNGLDLELVTLEVFAMDPDFFYWEYGSNIDLIDSRGELWSWKYDEINKTNLPGDYKRTLKIDEVRK